MPLEKTSASKRFCAIGTLKQSSAVHIQALVSADVILLGSSSKVRLLVINSASVPGHSWSIPQLPQTLVANCY